MMRRLRRFAAALVGVLAVQLTLLGAGTACAAPAAPVGASAAAGAAPGAHAAEHHRHGPAAPQAADGRTSDDGSRPHHHDGRTHCPAATSCASAAVAATPTAVPDGGTLAAQRVAALDATAPASVVGAPEPPPPRA